MLLFHFGYNNCVFILLFSLQLEIFDLFIIEFTLHSPHLILVLGPTPEQNGYQYEDHYAHDDGL